MNGDYSERLSQESECREVEQYGILERASAIALGVLKEIEALAGTTACKSVQLVRLKKWALEQGCWFSVTLGTGTLSRDLEDIASFLNVHPNTVSKIRRDITFGDK